MELVDLKQRFAKRSKRSVFLEVDLSRMSITNNEVEADTCEVDEGPRKRAYTPAEQQAQKKEKAARRAAKE
jgi:hypothetical protein